MSKKERRRERRRSEQGRRHVHGNNNQWSRRLRRRFRGVGHAKKLLQPRARQIGMGRERRQEAWFQWRTGGGEHRRSVGCCVVGGGGGRFVSLCVTYIIFFSSFVAKNKTEYQGGCLEEQVVVLSAEVGLLVAVVTSSVVRGDRARGERAVRDGRNGEGR